MTAPGFQCRQLALGPTFIYLAVQDLLILMCDLVPQPRIETQPLAVGTLRLSLWTTREAHRFLKLDWAETNGADAVNPHIYWSHYFITPSYHTHWAPTKLKGRISFYKVVWKKKKCTDASKFNHQVKISSHYSKKKRKFDSFWNSRELSDMDNDLTDPFKIPKHPFKISGVPFKM